MCSFIISAAESKSLRILLSFAVGGLLGDVFLHLLPQAWSSDLSQSTNGNKIFAHKTQQPNHNDFTSIYMFVFDFFFRWTSIDAKRPMGAGWRAYIHNYRENLLRLCKCRRKQSTTEMCWNRQLFATEEWRKASRKQRWTGMRPKWFVRYRGCAKWMLSGGKISAREENTSTEQSCRLSQFDGEFHWQFYTWFGGGRIISRFISSRCFRHLCHFM